MNRNAKPLRPDLDSLMRADLREAALRRNDVILKRLIEQQDERRRKHKAKPKQP